MKIITTIFAGKIRTTVDKRKCYKLSSRGEMEGRDIFQKRSVENKNDIGFLIINTEN